MSIPPQHPSYDADQDDATASTAPGKPPASQPPAEPDLIAEEVNPPQQPGNRFVRRRYRQPQDGAVSERLSAETLTASQSTRLKRILEGIRNSTIGSPIKTEMALHERIGKAKALAVLSSDALSSVAYGTEASLAILVTAGLGLSAVNLLIGAAIILLLGIVAFSYRQTIMHYPRGGGSYIVARAHLGENFGLVAAAALLLDYILTVSVSVSAGVDALISAYQPLAGMRVVLGVLFILIIVVINLRGIRDSGSVFAVPTYLFIGSFLLTIILGIARAAFSGGFFAALAEHPTQLAPVSPGNLSLFLILTAFASGCSAMTGTEAIADGVPIFKGATPRDQSTNAATTLIWMASILAVLYGSTTYLAWRFGISPQPNSNPTLTSQLAELIYTRTGFGGVFYYFFQFSTTLILTLAANTSFSDFPRLSSILARDDFMPHSFMARGGRLAFNTGILVLGVFSATLLFIFQGNTDALINLYALGVFTAFTLSQSGMVAKWRKDQEPGWQRGAVISTIGAIATGLVTAIIVISKTPRGAWIVLILVPIIVLMFKGIHNHYQRVLKAVEVIRYKRPAEIRHLMIVPIAKLDNLALRGLAYARSLSPHVLAVHVALEGTEDEVNELYAGWERLKAERFFRGGPVEELPDDETRAAPADQTDAPPPKVELRIINSEYRLLYRPLIRYIEQISDHYKKMYAITVVLPEYVTRHWWERLLHNQTALRLKFGLLGRPVNTANVPYSTLPTNDDPGRQLEALLQNIQDTVRDWFAPRHTPFDPTITTAMPPITPDAAGDGHQNGAGNGHPAGPLKAPGDVGPTITPMPDPTAPQ